ncbi:MAG: VCBS repeat-containing protein [Planctomycetales bacterium]|nr:VCBS repeat-containing protein [Planctomycetales bacterium]
MDTRCSSLRSNTMFAALLFGCVLLITAPACRKNTQQAANSNSNGKMTAPRFTDEIIEQHNRGIALMGQFEYAEAFKIFQKLAADHPNWLDVQVDFAIATLNRREPGDNEKALQILQKVAAEDPSNLRAFYCKGILALDGGDPELALKSFLHVAEADPADAYAVYYTGQCMSQLSDIDGALQKFLQVIEIDPYLRSAYYGAFQGLLRTGKMEDANRYRADFERLADNPQARLAEIKYTRMGPKATVRPIANTDTANVLPEGPIFAASPVTVAKLPNGFAWAPNERTSITYCDIDNDGDVDLFVANAFQDAARPNAVLMRDNSSFSVRLDHPLSRVREVNAVLWGDFDNDGFNDVYFCREGKNQLWRQTDGGNWNDVTESTKTSGGEIATRDGAFVDADHDGDLDIFLVNDGPNELLSNNLDGTFRQLGEEFKITGDTVDSRSVLFGDFDNDRDADVVVINKSVPHQVLLNDRLWSYHAADGFSDFVSSQIKCAVAADANADGQLEIYTSSSAGVQRWQPNLEKQWTAVTLSKDLINANRIEAVDAQGDGKIDLLICDTNGQHVLTISDVANPDSAQVLESTDILQGATLAPISADGPILIGFDGNGELVSYHADSGRHKFLSVEFSGKENQGEQMRSNRSGIGADVAVRRSTQWTAFNTFRSISGPGQSLGPVQVGLGTAAKIDFVQITWPDGVFQTEIGAAATSDLLIEETQRQVASCPVIFAWNGEKFEFVTDVLGVGGIGFNLGMGEYSSPRPWENIVLTPETLRPRDNAFEIRVGEPMEEACYLDAARLYAYDLPDEWRIVLDERLGIANPQPTGKALFYRTVQLPVSATNDRGEDVLSAISKNDHVAAQPGKLDKRFLGRTEPHSLTLKFDRPIAQAEGDPILLFDGWIEYPYSQTMFAAWQANATFDAPTLEARDRNGRWHVVTEQFGYMAGMPRRSAFPISLEKLPADTCELRLTCNLELYWDRIAIAYAEPCPEVRVRHLPLESAVVAEVGFAKRTTLAQHRPYYDYSHRLPMWDCRHMTGFYTSFGNALDLVTNVDDATAIIGPGEEVQLRFSASIESVSAGDRRHYVLELNGWAKDKDLYTRNGDTVGPLPVRDVNSDSSHRDDMHRAFNRRFRSGT